MTVSRGAESPTRGNSEFERISAKFDIAAFIRSLSPSLIEIGPSFWTSNSERYQVHYPTGAHQAYLAVEDRSYWFSHRNRCITSIVNRFPPGGPVLDVGGGNGIVSQALISKGFSSVVLEPGRDGVAASRARGLPVIKSTLQEASLREQSVPAVGMFDVLEHIPADFETLRQVHHLLQPSGRLFLTVPSLGWLWSAEDDLAGHARRYTARGLRALLEDAGFVVDYAGYMFMPLVPAIFLFRTLTSVWGRIKKSAASPEQEHLLPHNPLGKIITAALDIEYNQINSGLAVPIGSSLLAVASKRG